MRVSEVGVIQSKSELSPVVGQDKRQFVAMQWTVMMGKPNPTVELGIPGHTLFYARHADEHQTDIRPIKQIPNVRHPDLYSKRPFSSINKI
ncbi:MAG: hypothetical protein WCP96_21565, partial [Methylococcaceae bacterium]